MHTYTCVCVVGLCTLAMCRCRYFNISLSQKKKNTKIREQSSLGDSIPDETWAKSKVFSFTQRVCCAGIKGIT